MSIKPSPSRKIIVVLQAAFLLGVSGAPLAQAGLSDAQVESNVLRALAGAPELANQAISTRTVYGTVTLSGSVTTEKARNRAETLASTAVGVKKVVDELTLSSDSDSVPARTADGAENNPHAGMVLQSDGSYAAPNDEPSTNAAAGTPPAYQRNDPDSDQALDRQMDQANGLNSAQSGSSIPPQASPSYPQQSYPSQNYPQQGYPQQNYPQQLYPQQGGYSPRGYNGTPYSAPMDGGQIAGQHVLIPAGTLVRVRVNQRLASDRSQPGDAFEGVVVNDVVSGNAIAIPRGATVQGRVVDSKASGLFKGRGELTLELTRVMLAGRGYPIVSDQWTHNGADKTLQTVNRTAGVGALGAIVGAIAGGGEGAAIGAGVGAAAGLGSSAASGRGQVVIPSEAVVTFHLAQPATVETVSEQEMERLAYGVPIGADPRYARPRAYQRPYSPYPYGTGSPY